MSGAAFKLRVRPWLLLVPLAALWLLAGCSATDDFPDDAIDGAPLDVRHGVVSLVVERSNSDNDSFGAAIVWDAQGRLVTAHHVVQDARFITVLLAGGGATEAKVVAADPVSDVAVLQCTAFFPDLMSPVRMAHELPVPGSAVWSVGNPFGTARVGGEAAVSRGVVSALHRSYVAEQTGRIYLDCVQHDAPTNPGNSGGGIFNVHGEWLGMNAVITAMREQPVDHGVAFALPAARVAATAKDLLEGHVVRHGWLGARSYRLATQHNAKGLGRMRVALGRIDHDSPAWTYGLLSGDVLLKIDGREIYGVHEALLAEDALVPGNPVNLRINRAGREFDIAVVAASRTCFGP